MEDDNWNVIEPTTESTNEDTVEYEIEDEQSDQEEKTETVREAKEPSKKDDPKELEGIETKGAEKRIRQLVRQRKEKEEENARLVAETNDLKQKLSSQTKEYVTTQQATNDFTEKQLTEKIEYAREVLKDAMESQEFDKVVAAQEDLSNAQYDLRRIGDAKENFNAMQAEEERLDAERKEYYQNNPQPQQRQAAPPVDDRAISWAENNKWFGEDEIMTAGALAIDAKLKAEGWTPEDTDYYEEVDRRVQEGFPHKFEADTPKQNRKQKSDTATQTVAGASRSPASSKSKVTLTAEDVAKAKKWNIPLDRYAAEKLKTELVDDEYTEITL